MTLLEQFLEQKRQMLNDAQQIETATGYSATGYSDNYLMHGSRGDSSDRAKFRMEFVKRAEKEFVLEHRLAILARAAELCRQEIGLPWPETSNVSEK